MGDWAMAAPPFLPPSKQMSSLDQYVCTSDSSIHVSIVVVSAVLAHNVILTILKKKTWSSWTRSQMQTEGAVFRTDAKLQYSRSMTIGLHLHTWLTESTSNTDLHAWEHFQCWFAKTPREQFGQFLTPLWSLVKIFSVLHTGRLQPPHLKKRPCPVTGSVAVVGSETGCHSMLDWHSTMVNLLGEG